MSSKRKEQLQLYFRNLGPNVIMLRNIGTNDNSKKLGKIDHVCQL
jgi:hypothetical protein